MTDDQREPGWLRDADEVEPLRVAMKVRRLRILTVCCPGSHAVMRVYQTTAGRVGLYQRTSMNADHAQAPTSGNVRDIEKYGRALTDYSARPDILLALSGRSRGDHQGAHLAVMLDDPDAAGESVNAECACRENEVKVDLILQTIAARQKRLPLP